MDKLFLISIDCDMRAPAIATREKSLQMLYRTFDEHGIEGHITWFLNENDFDLTKNHPAFLKKVIKRGDCIGIHDHVDKFKRPLKRQNLIEYCRKGKESVERFLKRAGGKKKVVVHRNGCVVQDPELYAALKELGYTICSDVYPGMMGLDHSGNPGFDNRFIPEGIRPYRHDEDSYLHYWTTIRTVVGDPNGYKPFMGHFLQIPVFNMFLKIDFERMERWIKISEAVEFSHPLTSGRNPIVLTWCFHPYEILNPDHSEISGEKLALLKRQLEVLKSRKMVFVSMEECRSRFGHLL